MRPVHVPLEDVEGRSPLPIHGGEGTPVLEAAHEVEPVLARVSITVNYETATFDLPPPRHGIFPIGTDSSICRFYGTKEGMLEDWQHWKDGEHTTALMARGNGDPCIDKIKPVRDTLEAKV